MCPWHEVKKNSYKIKEQGWPRAWLSLPTRQLHLGHRCVCYECCQFTPSWLLKHSPGPDLSSLKWLGHSNTLHRSLTSSQANWAGCAAGLIPANKLYTVQKQDTHTHISIFFRTLLTLILKLHLNPQIKKKQPKCLQFSEMSLFYKLARTGHIYLTDSKIPLLLIHNSSITTTFGLTSQCLQIQIESH